ncbi:Uncharacterised protein [Klebsiella michiganensis]|uniref:Uncharacterized protein n=1 Tax=Klebsiella michiganensis TaxID=1134687 RepID=A0A7H4N0K5_9ENTR|nr:Uncharacterised protein [Klebsiella michiganensis]
MIKKQTVEGGVPHRTPGREPRGLITLPAKAGKLGQIRHGDREIDPDANPHQEPRAD